MKDIQLEQGWKEALKSEFEKPYFLALREFIRKEYQTQEIYPPAKQIFNAFDSCPFSQVRVVILGQDPYHGPGQAHGLSFSVQKGIPFPPSLLNIFKELEQSMGLPLPKSGDLSHWANQGVLLLNASLTVRKSSPNSHANAGWALFTDAVIAAINAQKEGIVFMLWGSFAQKKAAMVDRTKHLVLTAPHPSPLSAHRGFLGCGHFKKTNHYLSQRGEKEIIW